VRVVLDTNTVLSALLFPTGRLAWIRTRWTEASIVPLVCRDTVTELIRALGYPKFKLQREDIERVLAAYVPYTTAVEIDKSASKALPRCSDPHDQVFLALAASGSAEVLVTGDKALLALGNRTRFAIESPAGFNERLNDPQATEGTKITKPTTGK
jgi:uncharacterized protein